MTNNYVAINNLDITKVLNHIGIQFKKISSSKRTYRIDGTHGYTIHGNDFTADYVKDYSRTDRSSGNIFYFVKQYYNLSLYDTFNWFETNFGINNSQFKKNIIINDELYIGLSFINGTTQCEYFDKNANLKEENKNYNIYSAINTFFDFRRIKDNIYKYRYLVFDIDNPTYEVNETTVYNITHLKPYKINKTYKGFHVRFKLDESLQFLSINDYENIWDIINPILKGDPKMISTTGIIKVEGYYDKKPGRNTLIKNIYINENNIIYENTINEILNYNNLTFRDQKQIQKKIERLELRYRNILLLNSLDSEDFKELINNWLLDLYARLFHSDELDYEEKLYLDMLEGGCINENDFYNKLINRQYIYKLLKLNKFKFGKLNNKRSNYSYIYNSLFKIGEFENHTDKDYILNMIYRLYSDLFKYISGFHPLSKNNNKSSIFSKIIVDLINNNLKFNNNSIETKILSEIKFFFVALSKYINDLGFNFDVILIDEIVIKESDFIINYLKQSLSYYNRLSFRDILSTINNLGFLFNNNGNSTYIKLFNIEIKTINRVNIFSVQLVNKLTSISMINYNLLDIKDKIHFNTAFDISCKLDKFKTIEHKYEYFYKLLGLKQSDNYENKRQLKSFFKKLKKYNIIKKVSYLTNRIIIT